jgi:bacteriocin-like protein
MDDNFSQGELRQLSAEELQQITGGNAALATGLSAIFAGINTVVKAIEGVIVQATNNNPSVVSGINTFNQIGLGVENVAVGVVSLI